MLSIMQCYVLLLGLSVLLGLVVILVDLRRLNRHTRALLTFSSYSIATSFFGFTIGLSSSSISSPILGTVMSSLLAMLSAVILYFLKDGNVQGRLLFAWMIVITCSSFMFGVWKGTGIKKTYHRSQQDLAHWYEKDLLYYQELLKLSDTQSGPISADQAEEIQEEKNALDATQSNVAADL